MFERFDCTRLVFAYRSSCSRVLKSSATCCGRMYGHQGCSRRMVRNREILHVSGNAPCNTYNPAPAFSLPQFNILRSCTETESSMCQCQSQHFPRSCCSRGQIAKRGRLCFEHPIPSEQATSRLGPSDLPPKRITEPAPHSSSSSSSGKPRCRLL